MDDVIRLLIFLVKAGIVCMGILVGAIMYFAIDALIKTL